MRIAENKAAILQTLVGTGGSALDHRQDTHITATTVYSGQRYILIDILYITLYNFIIFYN